MHSGILLLVWVLAAAPATPHLAQATKLMDVDLDFAGAEREFEAALATPGNDLATVTTILEKQALLGVYSQEPDRAERYYRRLLVLSPDFKISASYGPKAAAPFAAAQKWVAQNGSLKFVALPPRVGPGSVEQVSVKVATDPMSMAAKVRFHLHAANRPWRSEEATLRAGVAVANTQGERLEWWGELLDTQQATVASVGSQAKPLVAAIAEAAVAVARPEPSEPTDPSGPTGSARAEEAVTETSSPGLTSRTLGITALAASGAALIAGAVFTVSGTQARARVDGAERDPSGLVTGLTQREAFELDARARSQAGVGAGLLVAGVALAVTGGVLVWQGSSVAVAVTPAGVAIAGVLP